MRETNGQRVAHKTLGKLLALGTLAGVYCFAAAGAAGVMMVATDMSAQARGGGHGTLAAMVAVILPAGVTADTSGTAVGMATA